MGDVRGQGLFQGIEFVKDNHQRHPTDQDTHDNPADSVLEPYPELTKFVVDGLKLHRIIVSRQVTVTAVQ